MKYIRTKNKIIENTLVREPTVIGNKSYHSECCILPIYSDDIIKQADTIKELIDEFVFTDSNNSFYRVETYNSVCGKDIVCYGAIWTDKGLIYVAKMKGILPNGKIDWELL